MKSYVDQCSGWLSLLKPARDLNLRQSGGKQTKQEKPTTRRKSFVPRHPALSLIHPARRLTPTKYSEAMEKPQPAIRFSNSCYSTSSGLLHSTAFNLLCRDLREPHRINTQRILPPFFPPLTYLGRAEIGSRHQKGKKILTLPGLHLTQKTQLLTENSNKAHISMLL